MMKITDQSAYTDLLAVLRRDIELDAGTVERLVALYREHGQGVNSDEEARLRIAVDMLPGRERCDMADFSGIGLAENSLDALFTAQEILIRADEFNTDGAQKILDTVEDESIDLTLRAALARIALDAMMGARNFGAVVEQVGELAAFLSQLETDEMEKCAELVMEVNHKCMK